MDANSSSRVTVTVFVSENMKNVIKEPLVTKFSEILNISYSSHLNETFEIQTTEITSGNSDKRDITVVAMYSITATGTSKDSTAMKLAGTLHNWVHYTPHFE